MLDKFFKSFAQTLQTLFVFSLMHFLISLVHTLE